ncbi:hypothetical protein FHY16_003891 [Xanthomonas campestris]|nr:hypothetical protein [Xanthomonas euroxanthea]
MQITAFEKRQDLAFNEPAQHVQMDAMRYCLALR